MEEKEERISKITKLYYSNPLVQQALFHFAKNREFIPRYHENFGKRPDALLYPSDIQGLINRGATSFHASEELWTNPLNIDSDMSQEKLNTIRSGWDLLIDIDSPYLDYSKISALLLIKELEKYGIYDYGIKFSGNKGFHIIVPWQCFPENLNNKKSKDMFPEWPRAICSLLMEKVKKDYNEKIKDLGVDFASIKRRMNIDKEDLLKVKFVDGENALKGRMVTFKCEKCGNILQRPNPKITKRKLKCVVENCGGFYSIEKQEDYYHNKSGEMSSYDLKYDSGNKVIYSDKVKKFNLTNKEIEEILEVTKLGSVDLVLVAPRHLFRAPFSLHEKTGLYSKVIKKEEVEKFDPKDANPLDVQIRPFIKDNIEKNSATKLLLESIEWLEKQEIKRNANETEHYSKYSSSGLDNFNSENIDEKDFPKPIKKLLKGLTDGRKRGLFVLLTFLKSLNFKADRIIKIIDEWNKRNEVPLRQSYIKGQLDWHFKQKKTILPPNYSKDSFYKDLGLIEELPKEKNPVVEMLKKQRRT